MTIRSAAMAKVRNWARNQECEPLEVVRPASADEVAAVVARAATDGRTVKTIGAAHSFTSAAMTDGTLVSLDRVRDLVSVDAERREVRVQAGARLAELSELLDRHGLALPNLGDINVQSVAGAVSTATHGTGRQFGNLSTMVVALELVDGSGRIVRAGAGRNIDVLHAPHVGVGAMGVLTEVTLRCVPAFNLHARETIEPLADILNEFDGFTRSADHAEFYWFPGTDVAPVKRNTRTTDDARPPSRLAYRHDKYLFENIGFGLACRVARRFPTTTPTIRPAIVDQVADRELVDRSDRVFAARGG